MSGIRNRFVVEADEAVKRRLDLPSCAVALAVVGIGGAGVSAIAAGINEASGYALWDPGLPPRAGQILAGGGDAAPPINSDEYSGAELGSADTNDGMPVASEGGATANRQAKIEKALSTISDPDKKRIVSQWLAEAQNSQQFDDRLQQLGHSPTIYTDLDKYNDARAQFSDPKLQSPFVPQPDQVGHSTFERTFFGGSRGIIFLDVDKITNGNFIYTTANGQVPISGTQILIHEFGHQFLPTVPHLEALHGGQLDAVIQLTNQIMMELRPCGAFEPQTGYPPIVVDLDGDGIEITGAENSPVYFDVDGDGFFERTAWAGKDDGLLVIDLNNDGIIDQTEEVSFAAWTTDTTDSDLQALKSIFDTNGDNVFNNSDTRFGEFRIWRDQNQNGTVESGELTTLAAQGISSIGLTRQDTDVVFEDGTQLLGTSQGTRTDGSTFLVGDVAFQTSGIGIRWEEAADGRLQLRFQGNAPIILLDDQSSLSIDVAAANMLGVVGTDRNEHFSTSGTAAIIVDALGGDDTLTGGAGADWLFGGVGDDTIVGGAGDDVIRDEVVGGAVHVDGGDGHDTLFLEGAAGAAVDLAAAHLEITFGSDGADTITTSGTEAIFVGGGDGNDTLSGSTANDELFGDAGDDTLVGNAGGDFLYGGSGTDTMRGGDGADEYVFNRGDGVDRIVDAAPSGGQDGIGTPSPYMLGMIELDPLTSIHVKTDVLFGRKWDEAEYLQANPDIVPANGGWASGLHQWLSVGVFEGRAPKWQSNPDFREFDDEAYLAANADVAAVWGNKGLGGLGYSHYMIYGKAEGRQGFWTESRQASFGPYLSDSALDTLLLAWKGNLAPDDAQGTKLEQVLERIYGGVLPDGVGRVSDKISFGAGIGYEDLAVQVVGSDLLIGVRDGDADADASATALADRLIIEDWQSAANRIERLQFSDGTVIGIRELVGATSGTSGADSLTGTAANNWIDGGSGADTLSGGDGIDVLLGGAGADTLDGGTSDDRLSGGIGNDTLTGGAGDDHLDGAAAGMAGNLLQNSGTVGSGAGWGHFGAVAATVTTNAAAAPDGATSAALLNFTDAAQSAATSHWVYQEIGGVAIGHGDRVTASIYVKQGTAATARVQCIVHDALAYHGAWAVFDFTTHAVTTAGPDSALLQAAAEDVGDGWYRISASMENQGGESVNARLAVDGGATGGSLYAWGAQLVEGSDAGVYVPTQGAAITDSDVLDAGAGNDTLTGGAGNDTLTGGEGNDVLSGGEGRDTLSGGAGNDVYRFGRGSGIDEISDADGTNDAGDDILQLGAGVSLADLRLQQVGNDLIVGLKDDDRPDAEAQDLADRVTLKDWFDPLKQVETFQASSGLKVDLAGMTLWHGGTGADSNSGGTGIDWLDGGDGADTIAGGAGGDILIAGAGADSVDGGDGSDIVLAGAGADTVTAGNGANTVFGGDENDTITSGDGADYLSGDAGADTLTAGAGNDLLFGGDGDDVLRGDGGNLLSYSGDVGNAARWAYGPTPATATANAATAPDGTVSAALLAFETGDHPVFQQINLPVAAGAAITASVYVKAGTAAEVWLQCFMPGTIHQDGYAVLNLTTGAVRAAGAVASQIMPRVEALADGWYRVSATLTSQDPASDGAVRMSVSTGPGTGTFYAWGAQLVEGADPGMYVPTQLDPIIASGDDQLEGGAGNDTLTAGAGKDVLRGGAGDDRLDGGEARDVLFGDAGVDLVAGGAGDDYIYGGAGADTIDGGAGTDYASYKESTAGVTVDLAAGTGLGGEAEGDVLSGIESVEGSAAGDTLRGDAGANHLLGQAGNDVLRGGAGADTLDGGDGSDTVSYEGSAAGVTVDLAAQTAAGGDAQGDVISGFETVIGSSHGDSLTGTTAANTLAGGAGDDTLKGNAGDDVYRFGRGDGADLVYDDHRYTEQYQYQQTYEYQYSEVRTYGGGNDGGAPWEETVTRFTHPEVYGYQDENNVFHPGFASRSDFSRAMANYNTDENGYTYIGSYYVHLNGTQTLTGTREVHADAGSDVLEFGTGITASDLMIGTAGADLIVGVKNPANPNATFAEFSDKITLKDWTDAKNRIETFRFADGTTLGLAGIVARIGTDGADTLTWTETAASLSAGAGDDVLTSGAYDDSLDGADGNDTLTGGAGNDLLAGGGGADTMVGGSGDDVYYVGSAGDVVSENAGEGHDTVVSYVSHTLGANVEDLTLAAGGIDGTGNALSNYLASNNGGANTLSGGAGDDTYNVDSFDTVVEAAGEGIDNVTAWGSFILGADVENLTLQGGDINGTGNGLANVLTGTAGNNVLNGGGGADTLAGGSGDDTYFAEAVDTITELADGGIDTIVTWESWTLGANFENLTLAGNGVIDGTGNALSNLVYANGGGANTMTGGLGDDLYYVDAYDTIVELAGEGTDRVVTWESFTLSAHVENMTLAGNGAINGTGNALSNIFYADGGGANSITGGAGNDTYYVDAYDTIVEAAGEGTEQVYALASFTLGANVENLTLQGSANIDATGNAGENIIVGNSGSNVLNGAGGNDTMIGGAGDDVFYVNAAGDTALEAAGEGFDSVNAYVSYALEANIESLSLWADGITGTGNALANYLASNNGVANTLSGGAGDDTYNVDSLDTIVELAGEGIDSVTAWGSFALGANVENLTLQGGAINGTGNAGENIIIGNSGNNVLTGGAANDTLTGGAGADTFYFGLGSGADRVTDFQAGPGADVVHLQGWAIDSFAEAVAAMSQSGSDVVLSLGDGNSVTFADRAVADFQSSNFTFA